jgi:hypothetical protein
VKLCDVHVARVGSKPDDTDKNFKNGNSGNTKGQILTMTVFSLTETGINRNESVERCVCVTLIKLLPPSRGGR